MDLYSYHFGFIGSNRLAVEIFLSFGSHNSSVIMLYAHCTVHKLLRSKLSFPLCRGNLFKFHFKNRKWRGNFNKKKSEQEIFVGNGNNAYWWFLLYFPSKQFTYSIEMIGLATVAAHTQCKYGMEWILPFIQCHFPRKSIKSVTVIRHRIRFVKTLSDDLFTSLHTCVSERRCRWFDDTKFEHETTIPYGNSSWYWSMEQHNSLL